MDRLTEKKASGRTLLSFTYDRNGNLTAQRDVTGKTTEYRYDVIDRITEVWDNGNRVAGCEYNPDDTIRKRYSGSLYTEYTYDADRNLIGLRTMLGDTLLADNRYHHDGNGNCTEKHRLQGTTTSYTINDYIVEFKGANLNNVFLGMQYTVNSLPKEKYTEEIMKKGDVRDICNTKKELADKTSTEIVLENGETYRMPNGWYDRKADWDRAQELLKNNEEIKNESYKKYKNINLS